MNASFVVGSEHFVRSLSSDIAKARSRCLVQAMTFEGDSAGLRIADLVRNARAKDRRILVDAYSRYIMSDKRIKGPLLRLNSNQIAELESTRLMFEALANAGTQVRVTNPVGRFWQYFPCRNHKKLVVVDDTAYIGGINFSDHNFEWHDFMVRLEDPRVADFLASDFENSWRGSPRDSQASFNDLEILSLGGVNNTAMWEIFRGHLDQARDSIEVISPYLTFPFLGWLKVLAKRRVRVRVFLPEANNKGTVGKHTEYLCRKYGFEVWKIPGMSHMKGMCIDDTVLVFGSSNFDFVSYRSQAEYVGILRSAEILGSFRKLVLEPLHANADSFSSSPSTWSGVGATTLLRAADVGIHLLSTVPRKTWIQSLDSVF